MAVRQSLPSREHLKSLSSAYGSAAVSAFQRASKSLSSAYGSVAVSAFQRASKSLSSVMAVQQSLPSREHLSL